MSYMDIYVFTCAHMCAYLRFHSRRLTNGDFYYFSVELAVLYIY